MKNKFLVALAALFWCVQVSWAQSMARIAAVRTAPAAGVPAVNPSLLNGIVAPSADNVSALPSLSLSVPSLPDISIQAQSDSFLIGLSNAAELHFAAPAPAALGSVRTLADAVAPNAAGEPKSAEQMQGASYRFFDRNLASPADDDADASASVEAGAASAGSSASGLAESAGASHLGNLYPRVVFIQDVFKGPAPKPLTPILSSFPPRCPMRTLPPSSTR